MRRSALQSWLGIGLLGLLLTCGCQHPRTICPHCGTSTNVAAAPRYYPYTPYSPRTLANKPVSVEAPAAPVAEESPVVHTAAKPSAVETPAETAPPKRLAVASLVSSEMTPLGHEGLLPRRTFTDITADPRFAHDPNYHWLVGTLDYSKLQDAWVLRYASVEEDDRYGGSVTLVNPSGMEKFKRGQLVRVEGDLRNADTRELRPPYLARSVRAVGP